jgi:hypothetical protein
MLESESSALPFGESPIHSNKTYYTTCFLKLQAFFEFFLIFFKKGFLISCH